MTDILSIYASKNATKKKLNEQVAVLAISPGNFPEEQMTEAMINVRQLIDQSTSLLEELQGVSQVDEWIEEDICNAMQLIQAVLKHVKFGIGDSNYQQNHAVPPGLQHPDKNYIPDVTSTDAVLPTNTSSYNDWMR